MLWCTHMPAFCMTHAGAAAQNELQAAQCSASRLQLRLIIQA